MMTKMLIVLMAVLVLLSLCACQGAETRETTADETTEDAPSTTAPDEGTTTSPRTDDDPDIWTPWV